MTSDMLSWTRQQIETRKALAEVASGEVWAHDVYLVQISGNGGFEQARLYEADDNDLLISYRYGEQGLTEDDLAHVAFNDPRQIIADCEEDLYLLDCHSGSHECASPDDNCMWILNEEDCPTLKAKARSYRHRPGYQPSWAPEGAAK